MKCKLIDYYNDNNNIKMKLLFLILVFIALVNGNSYVYKTLFGSHKNNCIKVNVIDVNDDKFSLYILDPYNYHQFVKNNRFRDMLDFICHDVSKCQYTIDVNLNDSTKYFVVITDKPTNYLVINELDFCREYPISLMIYLVILVLLPVVALLFLALCVKNSKEKRINEMEQNNDEYPLTMPNQMNPYTMPIYFQDETPSAPELPNNYINHYMPPIYFEQKS